MRRTSSRRGMLESQSGSGVADVDLRAQAERVESRKDLVRFVEQLKADYEAHPETWENDTVGTFLDGLAAWAHDSVGYFENRGEEISEIPPWRLFAMMLLAAKHYE